MLAFAWWLNIYIQSIINMGILSTILFFILSISMLVFYGNSAVLFLSVLPFFLPLSAINFPNPNLLLLLMVFIYVVLRSLNNPKMVIPLSFRLLSVFFGFSVIYSLLRFDYNFSAIQVYLVNIIFLYLLCFYGSNLDNRLVLEADVKFILLFGSMASLFCITHYFFEDETYLSSKIINDEIVSKVFTNSSKDIRRFLWPGIDPNFFAVSLIGPFFLSIYYALEDKRFFIVSVLFFIGIFGSFSRTGIILVVIGSLILMSSVKGNFKTIVIIFSLILLSIISLDVGDSLFFRILSISDNLLNYGGTGRTEMAAQGLELFSNNPFGIGLGNTSQSNFIDSSFTSTGTSHNTYVQILIESGIFLFIIFASAMVIIFHDAQKLKYLSYEMRYIFCVILLCIVVGLATIPVSDFRPFLVFLLLPKLFLIKK